MVELTLCFMVFLMLTFGLFEMGRAVWTYNTVAFAARQAARYASLHGTDQSVGDEQIRAVALANAPGLSGANLTATATWSPDRSYGSLVQVEVDYHLPLVVSPIVLKGDNMSLGATASAIVSQ